jgi:hypothetical protein
VDQWLLMHFISDLTGVPYDVLSSNETAMTITNLPMKRGGLGFLSQERMSPYAYAASLGMARAVMASRATEMIDLGFEDAGPMLNAQRSAGVPEVVTLPSLTLTNPLSGRVRVPPLSKVYSPKPWTNGAQKNGLIRFCPSPPKLNSGGLSIWTPRYQERGCTTSPHARPTLCAMKLSQITFD